MKAKVLVTGASGQIGSALVPLLMARHGEKQVIPTSFPPETTRNLPWPTQVLDVVDLRSLTEVVKQNGVDIVYHLAGILSATGENDPQLAWRTNVQGLKNVLDVARASGVSRVFWPSSIAVFGPDAPKEWTPQGAACNPTTMYGVTKVTGELLCSYYSMKYGVDVRCVRYPGIISSETLPGGGTTDYAVAMYYAAVRGEKYDCFVAKGTVLPMMYMPDALRAAVGLMEADRSRVPRHSGYNLAAVSFSAGDLEGAIRKRIPGFRVSYTPDSRQKIADSWPCTIDDSEARRDWGWYHEFDLEKMTDDMLSKLRAKGTSTQKDG